MPVDEQNRLYDSSWDVSDERADWTLEDALPQWIATIYQREVKDEDNGRTNLIYTDARGCPLELVYALDVLHRQMNPVIPSDEDPSKLRRPRIAEITSLCISRGAAWLNEHGAVTMLRDMQARALERRDFGSLAHREAVKWRTLGLCGETRRTHVAALHRKELDQIKGVSLDTGFTECDLVVIAVCAGLSHSVKWLRHSTHGSLAGDFDSLITEFGEALRYRIRRRTARLERETWEVAP